jgi:hypothetical protein
MLRELFRAFMVSTLLLSSTHTCTIMLIAYQQDMQRVYGIFGISKAEDTRRYLGIRLATCQNLLMHFACLNACTSRSEGDNHAQERYLQLW